MKKTFFIAWGILVLFGLTSAHAVVVDFTPFNIRNNNGTTTAPWDGGLSIIENTAGDGFKASTPQSGQKVGYGTNAFNGRSINTLSTVDWNKISGAPGKYSYLNMWVTDGTNYAIISSENDYRGTTFSSRQEWKIFEYDNTPAVNFDWLFDSGTGGRTNQYLTRGGANASLSDFSSSIIFFTGEPSTSPGVGSGSPQGGYGFNLIFGDTQANFVGNYELDQLEIAFGSEAFEAGNISAVPVPAAAWLFGSAIMGFMGVRRRRFFAKK